MFFLNFNNEIHVDLIKIAKLSCIYKGVYEMSFICFALNKIITLSDLWHAW